MSFTRTSIAMFAAAAALAGCRTERRAANAAPPADSAAASPASTAAAPATPATVTVTATDFKFDVPAQIPAGVVNLRLINRGKELHQAQLLRLEDGKTMADFAQAMKSNGPPPPWVKFVGGGNAIAPGQEGETLAWLTPGQYAMVCFIPSADGTPHVMKGMAHPFEVTGNTPASASLPAATDTIRTNDYTFNPGHALTAGHHTIRVENDGPQPHELVLIKLAPGKSVQDFGRWAESMKGPPPAMPMGGVTILDKGAAGVFTVDLAPGDYGLICFVPDAKDGKPHLAHGMLKQFRVS
jgi:hypothetical protein